MAWSLSHTSKALAYAADRIAALPLRTLRECAVGWKNDLRGAGALKGRGFNVRKLDRDALVAFVTEHALGDHGSTTNGGGRLYVDPDGYVTVPFGPDED